MHSTVLVSLLALALAEAPAAQRQAPTERSQDTQTPGRRVTKRPEATPAPAPGTQDKDKDAAARKEKEAAEVAKLRAAFGEEFYRRKHAAGEELAVARERAGDDDVAFAAARTEIARKYRGELATLRTTYAEKARALGVTLVLPGDDTGLEQAALAAAPAAALRVEFTAQVAALARAAQRELAIAQQLATTQETVGDDASAFAAKRTEIARRYRGQVLGLQQSIARRAAEQSVTVDTSDIAPVMAALAAAETVATRPREQRPAQPQPVTPPKPVDAEVLRAAFTKQVDSLRTALASELATAEATLKGDELAAKRASIVQKHRADLAAYRATVAARAQAAGVTLTLPTDQELVPELGPAPAAKPVDKPKDGQQPPKPDAPKSGDDAAPPKDAPPQPSTGGKRGRGPRFGGGG